MPRKLLGRVLFLVALLIGIYCQSSWAQISNGTVRGAVSDTTGAVIPNATVELVKDGTGERHSDQSNKEGYYTFTALSPGDYSIKVTAQGFDVWAGKLTLRVAQTAVVNAALKPGSVQQTVTVSDVTPVIDSANATLSDVKEATRIDTLPLQSSNFLNVLNYSPGVVANSFAGQGGGYTRVNGLTGGSMLFQVDGQSVNDRFTNELQVTPQALQTIQELKVTTSGGSAEYGQPGVVDIVTKSGTNQFHGQVHELYQNGGFEAKQFHQQAVQHLVRNEFGGQVGGPVRVPKIYNGKDRTFFYFDVEKQIHHAFGQELEDVPQTNWTKGDFTDYKDVKGNPVKIYDPNTTRLDPVTGAYVRDQFRGDDGTLNVIPTSRINQHSTKVLAYVPAPNIPGANAWEGANWENPAGTNLDSILRYTGKLDQLFGRNLLSARYTYTDESLSSPGYLLNPNLYSRGGHNGVISFTEPIGARAVNEARLGVQVFHSYTGPKVISPPITEALGLPTYPGTIAWPSFYWDDPFQYNLSGIDRNNPKDSPNQDVSAGDNFSLTMGKHEMKFGVAVDNMRVSTYEQGQPGGDYNFSGFFTSLQDPTTPIASAVQVNDTGSGLADFLLGLTDTTDLNTYPVFHTRQTDYSAYAQDDWKITPRLTLNLGLRYEYWSPFADADGLSANLAFDGLATSPGAGYPGWFKQSTPNVVIPDSGKGQSSSVIAAFKAAGLPIETASQAKVNNTLWNMPKNNWAPRLGAAYRFNDKTVIRGGYGLYYWTMPLVQYHQQTRHNLPWSYSNQNPTDPLYGNYGGPAELTYPVGPSTYANQSVGSRDLGQTFITTTNYAISSSGGWPMAPWQTDYQPQRVQEFNLNLERALPGDWAVSLGYVGNHGDHLPANDPVNALLPRELVPGGSADVILRRPYPIYKQSDDLLSFNGYSNHNQMTVEVRHVTKGSFLFQSYFTWSKTLTTSEGLVKSYSALEMVPAVLTNNAPVSDRLRQIYAPDSQLPAYNLVVNGHYELPVGRGKQFLAGVKGPIGVAISGWNSSVFYSWRSGLYFAPNYQSQGNRYMLAPGMTGVLPKGRRNASQWFDARVYDASSGAQYNGESFILRQNQLDWDLLSNIPRDYMTGPGFWNADGSLNKVTPIGEHMAFNLELQVFNIFNHVNLNKPNNQGLITSGIGQPRLLQFQGKITF